MADVKISALPAVVTAVGTDAFPVVQGGVTKQESLTQVFALLTGQVNSWTAQQTFAAPTAATIPMIAKGALNQTASFQEWQSSTAVPLISAKPTTGLASAKFEFASTIANSPWVVQATSQTFLSTPNPMLLMGYNINTGGVRLNTSDAAFWFQLESNYERQAADFWMEWNVNMISSTGAKTRRPYGMSIDRDDPDTFCAHTFGIHQALNGRVEICAISDLTVRLYDFRYDGFLTIATTTPTISLSQTGQANGIKNIRSNGGNLEVVNNAFSAVIWRLSDAGNVTIVGTVGFNNTAPIAKPVSGANLTNNVTVGGTTDQIDDFAGSLYATDAATIRNDIYQLARKLKQVNDGLRSYGLFT